MIVRKKRDPTFIPESEVHLCEKFIELVRDEGYIVYPEVSDWDIVLVNSDGIQIGVQAKMRPNIYVLYQAIRRKINGPAYRAVLVGRSDYDFKYVAKNLGLDVYSPFTLRYRRKTRGIDTRIVRLERMKKWGSKPLWLPPVPSHQKAGSPSPRTLTKWRVKAIQLCLLLEEQGYLTGQDFIKAGITQTIWLREGWLQRDGKVGRYNRYVKGNADLPIVGFEVEANELEKL